MIYLDHAAATPLSQKALEAMLPYFSEQFFNPSSPYWPAKEVKAAYRKAKGIIAHAIGAKASDLVMTSGATEANALAATAVSDDGEVLLAATEHASMRQAVCQVLYNNPTLCQEGEQGSEARFETVRVNRSGLIDLEDLQKKITDRTELISIALADNELGTIQPLAEVAREIMTERQRRLAAGNRRPLFLHTDASQALNLLNISVARLGADLVTLNAAKVYGPKGVGALYIGHQVKIRPLFVGGGQERGLRGGTENVPGVMGFAAAASESQEHLAANRKKYTEMGQLFRKKLIEKCEPLRKKYTELIERAWPEANWPVFLGAPKHQLANFCPVSFPGLDAERLVFKLDEAGVLVSTGAACAASKGQQSRVLKAAGLEPAVIAGSLRISMGADNSLEDMAKAAEIIARAAAEELARESFATENELPRAAC